MLGLRRNQLLVLEGSAIDLGLDCCKTTKAQRHEGYFSLSRQAESHFFDILIFELFEDSILTRYLMDYLFFIGSG